MSESEYMRVRASSSLRLRVRASVRKSLIALSILCMRESESKRESAFLIEYPMKIIRVCLGKRYWSNHTYGLSLKHTVEGTLTHSFSLLAISH